MYHDAGDSGTKTRNFKPFKRQNKRCTVAQKKALVEYMSTHTSLARYECDAATASVEWQLLAKTLNRSGTVKTADAWKVTWRDLRRKAARDVQEARATNSTINEISWKIKEIMAESDDDLLEIPDNIPPSPTRSISVPSPAEESDNDQEETINLPQAQPIQTMEVPAEDEDMQTRPLSPVSELESLQGAPESTSDSSPCTSPTPMNKARCTQDQINTLVDCMAINTSMAFGRQNTPKKAEDWRRLRQFLNRMGPVKRTVAWQKTWRDLKRGAVISEKAKPVWVRPTTKKILDVIEAYTKKIKENPNDVSADDDLFLPPAPSVHHAPSISPQSEYLALSDADRSKMPDGKLKVSPVRRSSSIMSSVNNSSHESSVSFVLTDNEHDSDDDSHRPQRKKVKKMRCTDAQKYAIVDYMARHPGLATSRASDGDSYYAEWRQLSKYLNKIGTAKTTASWKRTWRELKKNARCNRSSNHKWLEINERIMEICDVSANIKRQAKSAIRTGVEHDKPCANDDIPLVSLMKPTSHSPEVVLCEVEQANDTKSNQDQSQCKLTEESPERCDVSPGQRSEPSPARTKKERPQQSLKNTRCTPAQIHALMNYLAKHPGLARAKCLYVPKGRDPWYNEWRRVTRYLNSLNKMGPAKSTSGWKNTWRTLCLNARRKKSKQCPSYESVYKKVLKILGEERVNEDDTTVTKMETEDCDSLPTQTGSNQYSQPHSDHQSDPLQCEKDRSDIYKHSQDNKNHAISTHTSGKATDGMSPLQRGSRMSPVRISDNVRRSDKMSPGASESVHRLSRTSPGDAANLNGDDDNLEDVENALNRWGRPRKVRSSFSQLRALADYMIEHPELATDKYIDHREPAWLHLAKYLNNIGPARKRTEAWKRTWRDIKNGVRARGRSNQRSGCLESFREERVLKLIGISSPDRKNNAGSDGDHMDEEYLVPEPEVILAPRAESPHSQYNLTEILARSSPVEDQTADNEREDKNVPSEEPSVASTTNRLLQNLLKEVRRSNELSVQHNGYLQDILKQLRTQKCMHGTRHADRQSPINHESKAQEPKEEVTENTLEIFIEESASHCDEANDSHNEILVNPAPLIRPVSLSTLTSSDTHKPNYDRMKVQSILQGKVKPATPKGKLIRLKDGTMVLVPENMKMKMAPDQEKNGEGHVGSDADDQKLEANENDSWQLKTTDMNEY